MASPVRRLSLRTSLHRPCLASLHPGPARACNHLGGWHVYKVQPSVLRFVFSSRRRHTRLVSDWSSDVCSSDLFLTKAHASGKPRQSQSPGKSAQLQIRVNTTYVARHVGTVEVPLKADGIPAVPRTVRDRKSVV